jgi:hypothetical protein
LVPTPKSPKKPKMQTPGDIFPTDWSPPPVEFLNPKVQQYHQVGAESPQGPRRMPKKLELEPLDLDTKEGLASLEELFWNMPGTSQQTMTEATLAFSWLPLFSCSFSFIPIWDGGEGGNTLILFGFLIV